jgi:tetratricopeptide (TPR) repeat protein
VFNFKGRTIEALKAGRQLGVDAVLTGSVRRVEGRLRIDAALLDLSGGEPLWKRTYDRAAGDALLLQEEIVRGVLDEGIRFKPTEADRQVLARPATADSAAYDLYLRGLSIFRRDTEGDYLAAQTLLRQAIAKDPAFADGYAALAATYSVLAIDGYMRPNEAWAGTVSSAQRAIALDRDVPTAHAELGSSFFFFNWDWISAERAWETARRSRAGRYEPDFLMAYALERWATGRPEGALELARQARELDPIGTPWALRQADFLLASRNVAEAARLYELLTRELPNEPRAHFGLAEARKRQGRFDDAIASLAAGHAAAGNPALQSVLATAQGEAGVRRVERVTAQLQLGELRGREAEGRYVSPLDFSRAYAQIGDATRAFGYFPAAFAERSPGLVFLNVDHVWDDVRDEPVFREAVRRVGLAA